MKDEHTAGDIAIRIADRRGGTFNVKLVAVPANQQRRTHRLDRTIAANRDGQRILEWLAGLFMEAAEYFVDGP